MVLGAPSSPNVRIALCYGQRGDPAMLKRFQDIAALPEKDKECLLTTVDHFIKAAKISAL